MPHIPRRVPGWTVALPILLALHWPPALRAQVAQDTASLPEIVVTGTRYPVPPESLAATLTVVRGDDIRAQGILFVSDALREVPGVQVVQGGSFGAQTSVFLRGGESNFVKVLVDGVPLNQPGGAYDFGSLTTDNVERIEILRGPASVLYGSDAVSGVVQIITRRGAGPVQGAASAEGGTYGSFRWQGTAEGGSRVFDWSASVSRFTTDGAYAFNNDYRNTVASALLRLRPGARTDAALSARYADGRFNFPTDFTGALVDLNQFTTERTTTLSLELAHRFAPALEGRVLLGRNAITSGYDNQPDPAPGPSDLFVSTTDVERRTVDAHALFSALPRTALVGGVTYEHEHETSASDGSFGPSGDTLARHNWGFYLQASTEPWRPLRFTAGGRLDENERFGTFWTYRASALAFPLAATRLRLSVGSAFREPSFFENYATGFVVGNPDLRPERSTSFEAGIERDLLRGRFTAGVTGFVQHFRDLIQFTALPPTPGAPNYFNAAAANASGLEATLAVRRIGPLSAGIAYTRLETRATDAGFDSGGDAEFVQNQPLLRRPHDQLSVRAQTARASRLTLGAVLTYVGSREDIRFAQFPAPSRRVTLPAYATLDLSAAWTGIHPLRRGPAVGLTARVENLFDERYEQVAGFPARGRTVRVGASTSIR
jgi:vitamin B12 transporter